MVWCSGTGAVGGYGLLPFPALGQQQVPLAERAVPGALAEPSEGESSKDVSSAFSLTESPLLIFLLPIFLLPIVLAFLTLGTLALQSNLRALQTFPGSLLKKCFVVRLLPLCFFPRVCFLTYPFIVLFSPLEINNSSRLMPKCPASTGQMAYLLLPWCESE